MCMTPIKHNFTICSSFIAKRGRKKKPTTSQQAFQTFAGLFKRMNGNIEGLLTRLDTQNEIHRETNNLLKELIDVLKNKTN